MLQPLSTRKKIQTILILTVCIITAILSVSAADLAFTPLPSAESVVLSADQLSDAVHAHEQLEAQTAEVSSEAVAVTPYQPVYGNAVRLSNGKVATDAIKANGQLLGKYKLTFYCPCQRCSGQWGNRTSSGVRAAEGRTIAVDPRKIPIGSRVYIEGFGDFIAEDVGGAIKGNRIDIFVNGHARSQDLGVKYAQVYLMK